MCDLLVVRGEAGIGKTALLEYARATAITSGFRAVYAAGVESEAQLFLSPRTIEAHLRSIFQSWTSPPAGRFKT